MNKAAQALGRMARGKPKRMTKAAIEARQRNQRAALNSDGMRAYQARRRLAAKAKKRAESLGLGFSDHARKSMT